MSSKVRWPVIWQVVVWNKSWNKRVLYIYIYIQHIILMNIYIFDHIWLFVHIYIYILVIYDFMWFSQDSGTIQQLELRVSWLGSHGPISWTFQLPIARLGRCEIVEPRNCSGGYPDTANKTRRSLKVEKHDNLKIQNCQILPNRSIIILNQMLQVMTPVQASSLQPKQFLSLYHVPIPSLLLSYRVLISSFNQIAPITSNSH